MKNKKKKNTIWIEKEIQYLTNCLSPNTFNEKCVDYVGSADYIN